jgi:elongation factor Tu
MALNESMDHPSILGIDSVKNLMDIVDTYIPQPERLINAPFILSVEQIVSITGRGTVVTGKVEQGLVKINDSLELVGKKTFKTICIGLEMFRRSMDFAEVGDNVGVLVKGIKKDEISKDMF